MQVANSEANVYEYFPDYILVKRFAKGVLFGNEPIKVTVRTELKDDIDLLILDEGVVITNNVGRV